MGFVSRPLRVRLFDQASLGQRAADQPFNETGDRLPFQRRPARVGFPNPDREIILAAQASCVAAPSIPPGSPERRAATWPSMSV